jgi:hypothetical protein
LGKKLSFEVETAEIVDVPVDSQFATAHIRAFNTGKSLHDTWCDLEVLQRTASTLYEKPIIFELDKRFGDFGTHNDGVTVPAGFVVPNSATFTEEPDGRISLNVFAKIWKKYSGKFLEVFKDTDKSKKSVSVEMEVLNFEEMPNGLTNLLDFAYSAICVLGDYITPASPNSELEMLSFAKAERKEYKQAFEEEFASRYDEIDFGIPKSVKSAVKKALEKYETTGGTSAVALANAKYILANDAISPERLRTLYKRFQKSDELDDITLGLWGGRSAAKWAKEIIAQMEEADAQEIKYFDASQTREDKGMEEIDMAKENDKEEVVATEEEAKAPVTEEAAAPETETTPAEFAAENETQTETEEKAPDEKPFSYATIFSTEEAMSLFAEEEDDDEDTKAKFSAGKAEFESGKNAAAMMSAMFAAIKKMQAKMGRMAADKEVYMAENEELKKFKAETEEKQRDFAVQETMRELSEKANIPDDVKAEIIAEAGKHTLDTIDQWKNFAKAKSFDFAKPKTETQEEEIPMIGFAFYRDVTPAKDIWAD